MDSKLLAAMAYLKMRNVDDHDMVFWQMDEYGYRWDGVAWVTKAPMQYRGPLSLLIPSDKAIVLHRTPQVVNGTRINIPWVVMHHSPAGLAWGYRGSGAADLALNIAECLLGRLGYTGQRVACFKNTCYRLAFEVHQDLKERWIVPVPEEGGRLPAAQIETWLQMLIAAEDALDISEVTGD